MDPCFGGDRGANPRPRHTTGAQLRASPRMPSEMTSAPSPQILLYTRPGCHLCEDTRTAVQGILEDRAALGQAIATVREIDITSDPDIERQYFDVIPVVELGGRRLDLAISPATLRRFVAEALDANTSPIACQ